jgi:hypothetical protein
MDANNEVESYEVATFLNLLAEECRTTTTNPTLSHVHKVAYEAACAEALKLMPDAVQRHQARSVDKS